MHLPPTLTLMTGLDGEGKYADPKLGVSEGGHLVEFPSSKPRGQLNRVDFLGYG